MKTKAKFFFVLLIVIIQYKFAFSQSEVVNFLQGGIDDGQKLFKAYLSPYGNVLGADLNGGWFNTASTHKFPGFDITFTLSTSFVPASDKEFDINNISLTNLTLADSSAHIAQTIAGKDEEGPLLQYYKDFNGTPVKLGEFHTPKGTGWGFFPLPMIKASIGITHGFEIMGRYMPTYKKKAFSIGLWGIGLKHDILQYTPVAKKLPVLNVSVMAAYTRVKTTSKIDYQWTIYQAAGIQVNNDSTLYTNQNLEIICQGLSANLLVSVNLPVLTLYGATGYSNSSTDINLTGDYPLVGMNVNTGSPEIVPCKDPLKISIDNFSGLQFTGGARLKFGILTFHADYTYSDYSMISTGLGVSFR
jgi:hypothetical protein